MYVQVSMCRIAARLNVSPFIVLYQDCRGVHTHKFMSAAYNRCTIYKCVQQLSSKQTMYLSRILLRASRDPGDSRAVSSSSTFLCRLSLSCSAACRSLSTTSSRERQRCSSSSRPCSCRRIAEELGHYSTLLHSAYTCRYMYKEHVIHVP